MTLPEYSPPEHHSAAVAAGTAPLLVLVIFTLIVTRLIDADTGFAGFAVCTLWVAHEIHGYQKAIDRYNADYVARHLVWRSSETLASLILAESPTSPTREFVQRFLGAGRVLRPDGPSVHPGA